MEKIKKLLGLQEEDRLFLTSGRRENYLLLFFSHYVDFIRQSGRNHILSTKGDEPFFKQLQNLGCSFKTLPLNEQGQLTKDILLENMRPRSSLLTIDWADPITGVIQPIADIAEVCKENNIRLHVDATAVIGKLYFRFQDLPLDFLSLDQGALFVKASADFTIDPIPSQICADRFAEDLEYAYDRFDHVCTETVRLRDLLERGIRQGFPEARVLFQESERLPHVVAIDFPGVASSALQHILSLKKIPTRQGTAFSTLSFALEDTASQREVEIMVEEIVAALKKLRSYSEHIV